MTVENFLECLMVNSKSTSILFKIVGSNIDDEMYECPSNTNNFILIRNSLVENYGSLEIIDWRVCYKNDFINITIEIE